MECNKCNTIISKEDNFCRGCGTAIPKEQKIPLIGSYKEAGIYRITFSPVEDEFSGKEQVEDKARHSLWGEDREFEGFKVEKVRSTVTKKTHPYVCGTCNQYVSENTDGECSGCGGQNWKKRAI